MSVLISGCLVDGAGSPMAEHEIILHALNNSLSVIVGAKSTTVTSSDGGYKINAQTGRYCVEIKEKWKPAIPVGNIAIYADSPSGTLNDFLLSFGPDDLKPDVVRRFEELAATAQRASEDAKKHADSASSSALSVNEDKDAVTAMHDDVQLWHSEVSTSHEVVSQSEERINALSKSAQLSAEAAKTSENQVLDVQRNVNEVAQAVHDTALNVAENAGNVEELANRTAQMHGEVIESAHIAATAASSATQSAADADKNNASSLNAAERAEKAAADAEHKVDGAMQAENALSEITSLGEIAQTKARTNLGLGTAATQRIQSSKYDIGSGAAAIAGAFGFGGYLVDKDVVWFTEQNTLLSWVKYAAPGRYLVSQSGIQIIPGLNFGKAIIEVIPSAAYVNSPIDKLLRLYVYTEVYVCAFSSYTGAGNSDPGRLSDWKKTSPESLLDVLSSAYGERGNPEVGGLVLAAYQGQRDGDTNIQLVRGQVVSGSRLGQVGLEAGFGGATFVSDARAYVQNCASYPLPGAYRALSGVSSATGNRAWIGLFMRYA